ncbi:hypothetical protein C7212DRAFT_344152 [Tuber magnatum]|uniref:Uncharacterized protein n=1 Tax=Tuber magnatum TaxID=42249 RepID=A0A317SRX8_9PEZI|nr:hypothetical protein C7212DRAFT_344152 [Tuber magnatum]
MESINRLLHYDYCMAVGMHYKSWKNEDGADMVLKAIEQVGIEDSTEKHIIPNEKKYVLRIPPNDASRRVMNSYADDALHIQNMNLESGREQAVLQDSYFIENGVRTILKCENKMKAARDD